MEIWPAVKFSILLTVVNGVTAIQSFPQNNCTESPDPVFSGTLVNCSKRGFYDIPQDLLSNATTLLLSNNKLTGLPDNAFINLTELRDLNVSSNHITILHRDAFAGLGKLLRLSLWNNFLILSPLTYPADLFTPLVSLTTLILSHNSHSRTPRELSRLEVPAEATGGVYETLTFLPSENTEKMDKHLPRPLAFPLGTESKEEKETLKGKLSPGKRLIIGNNYIIRKKPAELDFPDKALSRLINLQHLSIDGLTNKSFGSGFRKLTSLTHLVMNGKTGYCKLGTFDVTTAANLPSVTHLNLSDCDIRNLTQDAFSSLNRLEELDLSFNQELGFTMLTNAFSGLAQTNLTHLFIDSVVHSRSLSTLITTHHLRFFGSLRYLQTLNARFNRIFAIEEGALCQETPPNLRYVNLDGNFFELAPYVNDVVCLPSLEQLEINGVDVINTPSLRPPDPENYRSRMFCHTKSEHRYEGEDSDEKENGRPIGNKSPKKCKGKQFSVPPRLHTLNARNFGLAYKLYKVRVNVSNSLRVIDLHKNYLPEWHGPVCGFERVTELYLMDTMGGYISDVFFSGFPALETLNISNNKLRHVFRNDHYGKIFLGLKNLRILDMSVNDVGKIHNETLAPLTSLEELYLSVNGMAELDVNLSHMTKLRYLDISQNQLHTIPKEIRDHLDLISRRHPVAVNMTFNPIICICSNIDFLRWIRESDVYFGSKQNYYCQNPDGSLKHMDDLMGTILQLEHTCGSYVGVFVGASACCIIVGVLMVVALAYRFRWKLRYLYYASRLGLQQHRQERQDDFQFDAFVSFSSEDNSFVQGDLREKLEDEHGLSLCIHTRDFMPGRYIASSIVDCVQRSRRTLVVLTRALLDSDWCHYELQMALMESVHTGRDVLVFLLYEHVPALELSPDMLASLQSTVYIEFPHSEEDRGLFWARLAQALRL